MDVGPSGICFAPVRSRAAPCPGDLGAHDLTQHPVGYLALLIFFVAYEFVAVEEVIQLRKSKPVMLAGGVIWALLGTVYAANRRVPRSKPPPSSDSTMAS